jgi:phospholipid transport system substrate-binding protein
MSSLSIDLLKFFLILLLSLSLYSLQANSDPFTIIQESGNRFLNTVKSEQANLKENPARLYAIVERDILAVMDFERFARFVLGSYWRQASPSEQARFVKAFRNLLVRTYSRALLDRVENLRISYLDTIYDNSRQRALVRSRVRLDNTSEIAMDYKLYKSQNDWKVYDVEVDGVSIAITFRNTFSEEINRLGLGRFLDNLEARDAKGEVIQ